MYVYTPNVRCLIWTERTQDWFTLIARDCWVRSLTVQFILRWSTRADYFHLKMCGYRKTIRQTKVEDVMSRISWRAGTAIELHIASPSAAGVVAFGSWPDAATPAMRPLQCDPWGLGPAIRVVMWWPTLGPKKMVHFDQPGMIMDFYGFLWIIMDYHGFFCGLSWIFLWIIMDSYGLSWIVMDYHGFLWILIKNSAAQGTWMDWWLHHQFPVGRFSRPRREPRASAAESVSSPQSSGAPWKWVARMASLRYLDVSFGTTNSHEY